MAKFLHGAALNAALTKILSEADTQITLISPYIKLHENVKFTLRQHLEKPGLAITVVFGKNVEDISKSVTRDDIDFFTQFPNVEIRHQPLLHAKYYANDLEAIITSLNLYDYSQNNNLEAGVLVKTTLLGILSMSTDSALDSEAYEHFKQVISQSKIIYKRTPVFDKGIGGSGMLKKYLQSAVEVDKLDELFAAKSIKSARSETPGPQQVPKPATAPSGYCIRTGVSIPFNPKRPMGDEAYKSWSKFSNPDYPEKFCHFSGEPSNGETTFSKPILKKNWAKSKDMHRF